VTSSVVLLTAQHTHFLLPAPGGTKCPPFTTRWRVCTRPYYYCRALTSANVCQDTPVVREVPVYIEKEVIKYEERDVYQDVSGFLFSF
jgi:hypothetical protein